MIADRRILPGQRAQIRVPVRVVQKTHVENQIGNRRHPAGKAETGNGDRGALGRSPGKAFTDRLLQIVAGEIGG